MKTIIAFAAAAAFAAFSAAASAEELEGPRLDEAWADLTADQEGILTEAQFAALNDIAFQSAVTKICDGYEVDQTKIALALSEALSTGPENMSENAAKRWEAAVLFRLGASYGIFLAEGNGAKEPFCASAAELKAAADQPNIWK